MKQHEGVASPVKIVATKADTQISEQQKNSHGVDMQEHLLSGTHCAEVLTIPQKIYLCATKHASCGLCLSNFVMCVDTLILSKS